MVELKAQREQLKAEKKAVRRDLKNEIRKRARLKAKAKKLSAVELVQVLSLRAQVAAKQEKKLEEKPAKSSPLRRRRVKLASTPFFSVSFAHFVHFRNTRVLHSTPPTAFAQCSCAQQTISKS